jgi:phenylacetate-CoA ligase
MIIGKNGARIPAAAMTFHSEIFKDVNKFQFHQSKKGEVTLKIVKKQGVVSLNDKIVIQEIKRKTGDNLDIIIEYVDDIQLTPRGKYKMIIRETEVQ